MTLISLILEQYRGVFERIYIFSPSIDDGWIPVKKYIEEDLGVNTEREQAYWDEWDEAALRRIILQQRKITEASKKLEMKLYQVLIICDDMADMPQLHKPNGALDTLFVAQDLLNFGRSRTDSEPGILVGDCLVQHHPSEQKPSTCGKIKEALAIRLQVEPTKARELLRSVLEPQWGYALVARGGRRRTSTSLTAPC